MKLNDLYSAQCALIQAKEKAFQIYSAVYAEQKKNPLTPLQRKGRANEYPSQSWGEIAFHESLDRDHISIEIEQYGIEQDLTRTQIRIEISEPRYCRGDYYENDSMVVPDWLFDDPSEANVTRFVQEQIALYQVKGEIVQAEEEAETARKAAEKKANDKKEFERLKKSVRIVENTLDTLTR